MVGARERAPGRRAACAGDSLDPLAHTLVGAALAKTRLARDVPLAMPVLVLAANVPDIDVAAYFWGSDAALAFRRGITHGPLGIAMLPAVVALVVWLAGRRGERKGRRGRLAGSRGGADASDGDRTERAARAAPDDRDWAHRPPPVGGPAHRRAAHREHAPPKRASEATAAAPAPSSAPALAPLLGLAYLGALTHPALDWLNTYGVRLLHPFDRRWFYGDTLFIVDPWMWLLLGAALYWSHRGSRATSIAWAGLAVLASVILLPAAESTASRAVWLLGLAVAAMVPVAGWTRTETRRRRAATACVAVFAVYLAAAVGTALWARREVSLAIGASGLDRRELLVGPLPVTHLRREVVHAAAGEIRYGRFRWDGEPRLRWTGWSRPRPVPGPVLDAALADPAVQGFLGWARFLFVEIDEHPDAYEVHLMDARYTLERDARFGSAVVRVPK